MSFQDFGGNRPASRTAQAPTGAFAAAAGRQGVSKGGMSAAPRGNSLQGASGGVGRGGVGGGGGGLGQISESLTQYQRNVGILEKIAQSILSSGNANYRGLEELKMQYNVQVDVIRQLEEKVRTQLQQMQSQPSSSSSTEKSTLVKLQRDFERVEARAAQWKAAVERRQADAAGNAASRGGGGGGAVGGNAASLAAQPQPNNPGQQDPYQLMQMQVQQDRLNEEIMREREEEIRNINRGMIQVNEIYKDLAHIVGQQQEQVDQIETQMEDAKTNAQSGLQQVEKANEKFGNANCTIS